MATPLVRITTVLFCYRFKEVVHDKHSIVARLDVQMESVGMQIPRVGGERIEVRER